jgi:sulfur carrier protein ThiS
LLSFDIRLFDKKGVHRRAMTAQLKLRGRIYEVRSGITIRDALRSIQIRPEAVLATRDGKLLTDDEIIREGDEIRLIAVISGGSRNFTSKSDR